MDVRAPLDHTGRDAQPGQQQRHDAPRGTGADDQRPIARSHTTTSGRHPYPPRQRDVDLRLHLVLADAIETRVEVARRGVPVGESHEHEFSAYHLHTRAAASWTATLPADLGAGSDELTQLSRP